MHNQSEILQHVEDILVKCANEIYSALDRTFRNEFKLCVR